VGVATSQESLSGDLARFSLFELLQYLCSLQIHGRLELSRDDGRTAWCEIVPGGLGTAAHRHLQGREAVFTFVWWKAGRFRFEATEAPEEIAGVTHTAELLLEAVRLADEVERHHKLIPQAEAPLVIDADRDPPADTLDCGLEEVLLALRRQSEPTLSKLEAALPLAPIKVRLALTCLIAAGVVRSALESSPSAASDSITPPWWANLKRRSPGGVRVLVGYSPETSPEGILDSVRSLSRSLRLPCPVLALSQSGPSFARLRPEGGGIVSLTFLPLLQKNRYLFDTFLRGVELVILDGEGCAGDALHWDQAVPPEARLVCLPRLATLDREIMPLLADFAEGSDL